MPEIKFPKGSHCLFDGREWEVLAVHYDRRDLIGLKNERFRMGIRIERLQPVPEFMPSYSGRSFRRRRDP